MVSFSKLAVVSLVLVMAACSAPMGEDAGAGGGTSAAGGGSAGGASAAGGSAVNGGGSTVGGGSAATGGGTAVGGGSGFGGGSSVAGGGSAVGGGTAVGGGSADAGPPAPCTGTGTCTLSNGDLGSCCSGICSGLNESGNCGGCGLQCPVGASCANYVCTTACSATNCPSGTSCLSINGRLNCFPNSCQAAGQRCARGNDAGAGLCCASGGPCLNTDSDPVNCGACGRACAGNEFCTSGQCRPISNCAVDATGTECQQTDGGLGFCCAGRCGVIDTQRDSQNCGGCGLHCPVGSQCFGGSCRAASDAGITYCGNGPAVCASALVCRADTRCVESACTASSPQVPCGPNPYSTCCGSQCANFLFDSFNCGACGAACGANEYCDYGQCKATPTCTLANSGLNCPVGNGLLGTCCAGACVDRSTNNSHCGVCGGQCLAGQTCNQGACQVVDGGLPGCEGRCPSGTTCDGQRCLPLTCAAGATGDACAFGVFASGTAVRTGECCNGTCVDTTQDPQHCNTCTTTCASGACTPGRFGGAACVPAPSTCAVPCAADQFCQNGICQQAACSPASSGFCRSGDAGIGVCCSIFSTQCSNLQTDPLNCGSCGTSCRGGTCVAGRCSNAQAPCNGSGQIGRFCNLDAGTHFACCSGGGCANLLTDSSNCGGCGIACGNDLTCIAGLCTATVCTAATETRLCARDAGVGNCCAQSCVDRDSDVSNCGVCGRSCVSGEICSSGSCVVPVCDLTTIGSNCQRDGGAGLCCLSGCVNTRADVNNCGGCNRRCSADAGCVNGACR